LHKKNCSLHELYIGQGLRRFSSEERAVQRSVSVKKTNLSYLLTAAALICFIIPSMAAASTIIYYQATDLTDTPSGEDLWEYTYTLSGNPNFIKNQGLTISFDWQLFSDLTDTTAAGSEWQTWAIPPNVDPNAPGLNLPGEYDALALVTNPVANTFSLTFVWLGGAGTTPGSQPFSVDQYDTDGITWLHNVSEGMTQPFGSNVVPEPTTGLLLASGLIVGAFLSKKRK
jgi:hypothetical protein